MNLDQLTLEIRPRTAWEAVDLGLLMAKKWWLPMTKVWLLLTLPLFALTLLIPDHWFWVGALLLWWLKPVFERPLLHILAHAVFNDLPDTRSTCRQFPSLARKQLFASLTWRRFSPTRAMDLSVLQLEDLYGTRRQERLGVLHREDSSPAGWMSFIGLVMEILLWTGMLSFIWALLPRELDVDWAGLFFSQESSELHGFQLLLWYIAISLTAPFYIACGFALYLNRRIKLEAWDIDIAFRRIANKRRAQSIAGSSPMSWLLAAALSLGIVAADVQRYAYAEDQFPTVETAPEVSTGKPTEVPTGRSADRSEEAIIDQTLGELTSLDSRQARSSIKEVMQQAEFSRKETRTTIKWDQPEDEEPPAFWKKLFDFLRNFEGFVAAASVLEIILWIGVAALIAFVFFRYRHWLAAQFVRIGPTPAARAKPETLFGMEVTRESLPEDISSNALSLLQAGNPRAALALLYRASLFHLVHSGVDIHDGHTEAECVELMRAHFVQNNNRQQRINYFAQLTRVWQRLAYGHLMPDAAAVHDLCASWNQYWLDSAAPPTGVEQ